jgi:hypothetical protein
MDDDALTEAVAAEARWYAALPHEYLSTSCLHASEPGREDLHGYCQAKIGQAGEKRPASCKFCAAPCICPCHTPAGKAGAARWPDGYDHVIDCVRCENFPEWRSDDTAEWQRERARHTIDHGHEPRAYSVKRSPES